MRPALDNEYGKPLPFLPRIAHYGMSVFLSCTIFIVLVLLLYNYFAPSRGVKYCDQLSVCLSVCLSVHLHMSKATCPNFLYMLPVAVALFSDGNVISFVYGDVFTYNAGNRPESQTACMI